MGPEVKTLFLLGVENESERCERRVPVSGLDHCDGIFLIRWRILEKEKSERREISI